MPALKIPLPDERDELIEMQKQVIGILFEAVKRLQRNIDLEQEYFQIVMGSRSSTSTGRLEEIRSERAENTRVISRLLEQLDT